MLQADGIGPDFEVGASRAAPRSSSSTAATPAPISTSSPARAPGPCRSSAGQFRVAGKAPELWDAVTSDRQPRACARQEEGRTTLTLNLAPFGSVFVIFRESPTDHVPADRDDDAPSFVTEFELSGPWEVAFDPRWGGPTSTRFDRLVSWTTRPEPGIRFYSGTATYRQTFDLPDRKSVGTRVLDLGDVRELAEVPASTVARSVSSGHPRSASS